MTDFSKEFFSTLQNLNWLAVVVAALSTFAVGAAWYHEKIMGTRWMKAVGLKQKDIAKANMNKIFGFSMLGYLLCSATLGIVVKMLDLRTALDGGILGLVIGIFVVGASTMTIHLFEQRKTELIVIDVAYHILNTTIMTAILTAWR